MGHAASRDGWGQAVFEEKRLSSALVLGACRAKFGGVKELAGIVEHGTSADKVVVDNDAEGTRLLEQRVGRFEDEKAVSD